MCGITGIFHTTGKPADINTLKRMTDAVKHRGPDGEGYWSNSFVAFGHRRLAIIDLSPAGHQPMLTKDEKFSITYLLKDEVVLIELRPLQKIMLKRIEKINMVFEFENASLNELMITEVGGDEMEIVFSHHQVNTITGNTIFE